MASVRKWSANGITLLFIGAWNVTAGNIFADPTEKARDAKSAKAALLGVPLSFEANQGQTDRRVKFLSHGNGYALFLTSNEAVLALKKGNSERKQSPAVPPAAKHVSSGTTDFLAGKSNYFVGNDPAKWQTNV